MIAWALPPPFISLHCSYLAAGLLSSPFTYSSATNLKAKVGINPKCVRIWLRGRARIKRHLPSEVGNRRMGGRGGKEGREEGKGKGRRELPL